MTQWKWGEIIFPNTITKVIDEWNGEFFDYKTDFRFNFIIKQENFVAVISGISPLLNHTGMVLFV